MYYGEEFKMWDFSFTEEQLLMRQAIREWCERNLTLEAVRDYDTKEQMPKKFLKGIADLGLIIPTMPEEHGGIGCDWITATMIAEELGYWDLSIALPVFYLLHASWGYCIDRYASEEVRDKYIRPAAKGEGFTGIGVTEPGGGSDVAGFKTTLKKEDNHWLVNGEKLYISGTEEAKEWGGGYYASGYHDRSLRHRGMTGFFLGMDMEGVEVTKRFDDVGRMAISTGGFTMDNVKVPLNYQLGKVGEGFYLTMEGFDAARLLVATTCVGAATRALEIGMDYLKERTAFGQRLADFQGIQFNLAELSTDLEAQRLLMYKTATMLNKKYEDAVPGEQPDRAKSLEAARWISYCKLRAPSLAFKIFYETMLWFGAYGYTKECPLEMGLRGVLSYCIGAEGSQNVQKIVIARELLR
jgi:acyl-CoA dehydrogenase